jgi:hypothetical protein
MFDIQIKAQATVSPEKAAQYYYFPLDPRWNTCNFLRDTCFCPLASVVHNYVSVNMYMARWN